MMGGMPDRKASALVDRKIAIVVMARSAFVVFFLLTVVLNDFSNDVTRGRAEGSTLKDAPRTPSRSDGSGGGADSGAKPG